MTSKRHLFFSSIEKDLPTKFSPVCQVCGDRARILNYGALSCSSCKTFFRRRGFNVQTIPECCFDGNCSMTVQSRRNCTACRLAKCLAVGMSPDLIRKEDLHEKYRSKSKFRQALVLKNTFSIPQPCLLNLLSVDQSSLTQTNWKLFSNVIHAFDTYSSVSATHQMVNVISTYSEHLQVNAEYTLNMIGLIYSSLQSFVNCIADFRIMTTAEQCSLLQRNMRGLLAFYCIFVFREAGVFYNKYTEKSVLPLYGYQNVQYTKYLTKRLDYDPTLIKLMLISLIFSSNCFTINEENNVIGDILLKGTFRLLGSQNVYVEILWKYMLYRYGLFESVQRFDRMIKVMLDVLRFASDISDNNKLHRNFIDDFSDQCEHSLKLNGSEIIPLWGKD